MSLNVKSNSKLWITTRTHHNVSLRSGKDLSLETKKLLMSHCFVDVKCATPILMSLSWIFSIPNKIQEERPTSSIYFVVHPAFFHPSHLLLSHLHYKFWKKIVTLSSVIVILTREFYTMEIGFKLLCDNIKVWLLTSVTLSRLGCTYTLRAAIHMEAGPIRCVRGLKSSLVIGQKAQIGPNPFTRT